MAQNLQLDPKKKDYVVENGSPIASDRVLEAAYYAITIPQGQWLYGTIDQGSLLYTLANKKRFGTTEQNFEAYAVNAINKQVVETGQAKRAQVTNIEATRTGTVNKIDVQPSDVQISNQINFIPVGS